MLTRIGLLGLILTGALSGAAQAQTFSVNEYSPVQPVVLAPGDTVEVTLLDQMYLADPVIKYSFDGYQIRRGLFFSTQSSYKWHIWRNEISPPQLELIDIRRSSARVSGNPQPYAPIAKRPVTFVLKVREDANARGCARIRFTQTESIRVDRSFDVRIRIREGITPPSTATAPSNYRPESIGGSAGQRFRDPWEY